MKKKHKQEKNEFFVSGYLPVFAAGVVIVLFIIDLILRSKGH